MAAEKQIRRKHTARELAEKFGVHPRTVQRYIALPRDQYLAESITRAAPWEALGMSRATWYRKGKPTPISPNN
jgi:predicted DNA-binding transcriptional regulator YafY